VTTKRKLLGLALVLGAFVMLETVQLFVGLAGPLDLPFQRVAISIDLDAGVDGDTVRIAGSTNLPDGALVDYWFYQGFGLGEDGPAGTAQVQDGNFVIEHDMTGYGRGEWKVEASFSTVWGSEQPSNVIALVGDEGEHLAGPQVYVDSPGDAKQIFVSTSVTLP
jgi:hypothetical protein